MTNVWFTVLSCINGRGWVYAYIGSLNEWISSRYMLFLCIYMDLQTVTFQPILRGLCMCLMCFSCSVCCNDMTCYVMTCVTVVITTLFHHEAQVQNGWQENCICRACWSRLKMFSENKRNNIQPGCWVSLLSVIFSWQEFSFCVCILHYIF